MRADGVREKLLSFDPEIKAIIRFGSSVYLPDLARDEDLLLVVDEERASSSAYRERLRAFRKTAGLSGVDPVLAGDEPTRLSDDLAVALLATGEPIYGDGAFLADLGAKRGDAAAATRRLAADYLAAAGVEAACARRSRKDEDRDFWVRRAYDCLFKAVRAAFMCHLAERGRQADPAVAAWFRRLAVALHYAGERDLGLFPARRLEAGAFIMVAGGKGRAVGEKIDGFIFTLKIGEQDRRLHVEIRGDRVKGYARFVVDSQLNIEEKEHMPDAYTSNQMRDAFEANKRLLLTRWERKIRQYLRSR